ncbi:MULTISPECIES: hypothetical protein [Nocardiaceae]|uniref:hypothetical protein n=1 Tax=Nocardiaceae TaxID=85025 RepID=UPI0019D2065F|nr:MULTISPECIES: hypothetical protein [Rhodococcus]MDJ0004335.1 hypothetical protein [Rhodococcus fascians]
MPTAQEVSVENAAQRGNEGAEQAQVVDQMVVHAVEREQGPDCAAADDERGFAWVSKHFCAGDSVGICVVGVAFPEVAEQEDQAPADESQVVEDQNEVALTESDCSDCIEGNYYSVADESPDDARSRCLQTGSREPSPVGCLCSHGDKGADDHGDGERDRHGCRGCDRRQIGEPADFVE